MATSGQLPRLRAQSLRAVAAEAEAAEAARHAALIAEAEEAHQRSQEGEQVPSLPPPTVGRRLASTPRARILRPAGERGHGGGDRQKGRGGRGSEAARRRALRVADAAALQAARASTQRSSGPGRLGRRTHCF